MKHKTTKKLQHRRQCIYGLDRKEKKNYVKIYLFLLEFVGAKDLETLLALAGAQPLAGAFQLLEHLLDGDVLLQIYTNAVSEARSILFARCKHVLSFKARTVTEHSMQSTYLRGPTVSVTTC